MMINLLFLGVVLYRKVEGYPVQDLLVTLVKVTGAAGIMGVLVWGVHSLTISQLGGGLLAAIIALGGSICLGIAVYVGLISFLNIPEFQNLWEDVKSRWRRTGRE